MACNPLTRHCGICEHYIADGDRAVLIAHVHLQKDNSIAYTVVDLFHETCHQRVYPEKPLDASAPTPA